MYLRVLDYDSPLDPASVFLEDSCPAEVRNMRAQGTAHQIRTERSTSGCPTHRLSRDPQDLVVSDDFLGHCSFGVLDALGQRDGISAGWHALIHQGVMGKKLMA